jgi:hypothetical protein
MLSQKNILADYNKYIASLSLVEDEVECHESEEEKKQEITNEVREVNSLIEAYMSGKLKASVDETSGNKIVSFPDYTDASITFVKPIKEAYEELMEDAHIAWFKISGAHYLNL